MTQRLARFICSILLVIIVTGCSLLLLMTSTGYDQFISSCIGFERVGESLAVRDAIHDYFLYGTPLSTQLFTERELVHMTDVRNLVQSVRVMMALGIGLMIVLSVAFQWSNKDWMNMMHRATFVLLGLLILVILIAFSDFDAAFVYMHEHIFANDYWLLDPAHHALIRAYPSAYFFAFVQYWLGGLAVLAVVTLIAITSLRRRPRG